MALSAGSRVDWSDISSLFSSLNNTRSHWGFSQFTPSSTSSPAGGQGVSANADLVSKINTMITEMASNAYVRNSGLATSRITVPSRGTLLRADIFPTLSRQITDIYNVCSNDSNFGNRGNNGNFGDNSNDSRNGNNSFNAIFGFCWNQSQ